MPRSHRRGAPSQHGVCGALDSGRAAAPPLLYLAVNANECATTLIERDDLEIAVARIASRPMRQIAAYVIGEHVSLGQRIGVIRLGPLVDVVLPPGQSVEVDLRRSDRVWARRTVLGRLGGDRSEPTVRTIGTSAAAAPHRRAPGRAGARTVTRPLAAALTTVFSPASAGGAYGFSLAGVDGARELLVDAPTDWPLLELRCRVDDGPLPDREVVSDQRAELLLTAGGWVAIERASLRAEYVLPRDVSPGALVHPHLAPVAAIASRWLGRESFHAGAVVIGDGAWGVLGDKEAGKSSTLAWLALAGHPVLADDLVVLDGGSVLAGPRSIDLREPSALQLGVGEPLGRIGLRNRWRLQLPPAPTALPLRGWIVLTWGDGPPSLHALEGAARLQAILPHRAVRLTPTDPGRLVALSALPCHELCRPRAWSSLPDAADLLARSLSGLA